MSCGGWPFSLIFVPFCILKVQVINFWSVLTFRSYIASTEFTASLSSTKWSITRRIGNPEEVWYYVWTAVQLKNVLTPHWWWEINVKDLQLLPCSRTAFLCMQFSAVQLSYVKTLTRSHLCSPPIQTIQLLLTCNERVEDHMGNLGRFHCCPFQPG